MAKDPDVRNHQEWLGYVQPVGLVVSIPALLQANARINRNFGPDHQRFLSAIPADPTGEPMPEIADFVEFAQAALGWSPQDLYGAPGSPPIPDSLEAPLPEYNETLRPTYALREFDPKDSAHEWILLVDVLPTGTDLDAVTATEAHRWQASPQARFERLLRETGVPTGLLVNGRQIRLVYAPKGESSGYITFNLADMVQVAGRPIVAAFVMLFCSERLYSMAENERLPAILANSRKFQNVVSTQLAGQVLEALYELLRGFQAADDQAHRELLRDVMARDPNHVYAGLVTTLLRLVFILFAEDRDLLSTDSLYLNNYSLVGLYDRLRTDDGRYHDTMDQRYGAWAQLLALFRLIYQGGSHSTMRIPAREGYLFDPDRYLFLEGRRERSDPPAIPRVSDGVIFRILSKLLLLDGERLSYRTLAVEQIGSVYEAIMGFELHVAAGPSIAIKPAKRNGAPTTINLEELLAVPPDTRLKSLTDSTEEKLTGQAADALKSAANLNDLLAALDRKIAKAVTPNIVPNGAMIFQPSNERRRSGSHYTPSSLTGPIVEAALRPVLKQLGDNPTPEQILQLKVCDPAMGSGAFLVEACRQLAESLVKAWHSHDCMPPIPRDEDELLSARRLVAQRCFYGVDKNPLAADLAKLSLWLATLAKDHPFTFLNHSLRAGDSLVGLTRQQIAAFHWLPAAQQSFLEEEIRRRINRVSEVRHRILAAADDTPYSVLQARLEETDAALTWIRMAGDAAIAAFFAADKARERERIRVALQGQLELAVKNPLKIGLVQPIEAAIDGLRKGPKGVMPFHWEIEFPEVFTVDAKGSVTGGFDAIVGNPPFAGKNTLINAHADGYLDWLQTIHEESHGNSDLIAHFFRRAFSLMRPIGCLGLIATNTIAQGDTRSTGLRWICTRGGTIYQARKRLKWPGQAAVIVSVIHVARGSIQGPYLLDGTEVPLITAFLFHAGGHEDPTVLKANADRSFQGCILLGMGFTFDDSDVRGRATPLTEMERLTAMNSRNRDRIFPFIGYEEVATSPTHAYHRYAIDFEDFPLMRSATGQSWFQLSEEAKRIQLQKGIVAMGYPGPVAADWPDLLAIVREKVKPERDRQKREANRDRWWQYAEKRPGLRAATRTLSRVIVAASQASTQYALAFLPKGLVYSSNLSIITLDTFAALATLQSRVHEIWARFFMSTMKDDLAYTPTTCFEPFPFPDNWTESPAFERVGESYHEFRAALMIQNNEGLTATYNRFHEPEEDNPDIVRLRELHAAMDRAVLDAYGWTDIQPKCEFLLDYEEEEDEEENGPRRRKKPWRYRWPDEIRDEVLARLLELNRQRALEDSQIRGAADPTGVDGEGAKPRRGERLDSAGATALFGARVD
jgi:hypothetical protein